MLSAQILIDVRSQVASKAFISNQLLVKFFASGLEVLFSFNSRLVETIELRLEIINVFLNSARLNGIVEGSHILGGISRFGFDLIDTCVVLVKTVGDDCTLVLNIFEGCVTQFCGLVVDVVSSAVLDTVVEGLISEDASQSVEFGTHSLDPWSNFCIKAALDVLEDCCSLQIT